MSTALEASPGTPADGVAGPTRRLVREGREGRAGSWTRFVLRRVVGLVTALLALLVAVFVMVRLIPGDPVINALGTDATPETIARLNAENGFDKPLYEQFLSYVSNLFQGDLGRSFITNEPVTQIIGQRIGPSLQLAIVALALVFLVSIPLGMVAGGVTQGGRHRRIEVAFTSVTGMFAAIPDYLTATILAFLFAVQIQLFPVAGADGPQSLVLPVLAVSAGPIMTLARLVRLETLNVLSNDYIRTARSQRLPRRTIYGRHALPNVLTAALTIGGLLFANLIGGAVIVENVFARPGLGSTLVQAVVAKEYVVVQGVTIVLGAIVIGVIMLVDVALALVDPRSLTRST